MSPISRLEAPTQAVQAQGIRFAYRRLGSSTGTPLLLIPHFRGGMDHWDPLVTDGLGASRPAATALAAPGVVSPDPPGSVPGANAPGTNHTERNHRE